MDKLEMSHDPINALNLLALRVKEQLDLDETLQAELENLHLVITLVDPKSKLQTTYLSATEEQDVEKDPMGTIAILMNIYVNAMAQFCKHRPESKALLIEMLRGLAVE